MGTAIKSRLAGLLGLILTSFQLVASSGCATDSVGPGPSREKGDPHEVAVDTATMLPEAADLVADKEHVAHAHVRGSRIIGQSGVLGVLHEPSTVLADDDQGGVTCLVEIWYYLDTGEVIAVRVLFCTGNGSGRGGGPASSGDDEGECQDGRDDLAAEYTSMGWSGWPCEKFQNSVSSAHFSWSELNDGWSGGNESHHRPWGYINMSLVFGLEQTRRFYGRGGIRISSGYRCPNGNRALPDASATSKHMEGLAADMFSASHPWTEAEFNLLREAAKEAGAKASDWNDYTDHHLHVTW